MIRQRPLALTATIAFTAVAAGFGLATPQRAEAAAPPTVDPVIEWNRTILQLIRMPGVQRSFSRFSGAAQEAALSRIYAGQHTRVDHVAGVELGRNVAHYVLRPPFEGHSRIARIESATVVVARRGKNASARFSSARRARDS